MQRTRSRLILIEVIMIMIAVLFLFPILLVLMNSFKTFGEVMTDVMALPHKIQFANYSYVWTYLNYPRLFLNTAIITALGVAGIILFGSMASYKLARTKTKWSGAVYLYCIIPMLIPFQTIMITVLKLAKQLHLSESTWGLGIQYWGFGIPLAVFIYHGFTKSIPLEIDESAKIDGASGLYLFFKIIFPLLRPVTATVIIIDVMWIWNDFLLPLIMVNGTDSTRTLTLAAYTFVGQYTTDWQYTMTAMVMAVFPSILVFILMQKHIVKGVAAGAVKG